MSIAAALIGGLIGFLSAVFAEPLRRWCFSPSLVLQFDDGPDCRAKTPAGGRVAEYVRVRVKNASGTLAKECRAYLVRVERKADKTFHAVLTESIPLVWSCQEEAEQTKPLDIPRGVTQYIDLVSVADGFKQFRLHIKPVPTRYTGITNDTGTFRFTIQVAAENARPKFIRIDFEWSGDSTSFQTQLVDVCNAA